MVVTILVEPTDDSGFRAVCADPIQAQADAATRDEAVEKLRQLLAARLSNGAEVVDIEVGPSRHPLEKCIGIFKDDIMLEDWKAAIEENREDRQHNAEFGYRYHRVTKVDEKGNVSPLEKPERNLKGAETLPPVD